MKSSTRSFILSGVHYHIRARYVVDYCDALCASLSTEECENTGTQL
jgi:hypothetical protein